MAPLARMSRAPSGAQARRARLALTAVAASWGLTFTLTKVAVADLSPEAFVCGRFFVATAFLLPWLPPLRRRDLAALGFGLVLGALNIGVHLLQATSLTHIGAARCGFLAGSHLLFVPLFELASGLGRPHKSDGVAIALCLVGLYLLTGADLGGIGRGDAQAVAAEIFFAAYMIVTTLAARRGANLRWLTLTQLATTALVAGLLAWPELRAAPALPTGLRASLLTCGLVCTLGPIYLQMRFQPVLRPSHAALLLSLEPVFAGALAFVALGEALSPMMLAGATLMLLASLVPGWAATGRGPAPNGEHTTPDPRR